MVNTIIREWRKACGVSQAELATRLGVSQAQVSKMELGAAPMPGSLTDILNQWQVERWKVKDRLVAVEQQRVEALPACPNCGRKAHEYRLINLDGTEEVHRGCADCRRWESGASMTGQAAIVPWPSYGKKGVLR